MTAIQVFQFQGHSVRIAVADPNAPEWVASDVCEALEIAKSRDAIARLDDDEKGRPAIVDTPGGPQEMATVTEPGLYSLIMRSRKPAARSFQRWVTHEVLPSIRKTGSYGNTAPQAQVDLQALATAVASVLAPTLRELMAERALVHCISTAEERGLSRAKNETARLLSILDANPKKAKSKIVARLDSEMRMVSGYGQGIGTRWANCTPEQYRIAMRYLTAQKALAETIMESHRQVPLPLAKQPTPSAQN